jgi:predicted HTH transcriptional regulator
MILETKPPSELNERDMDTLLNDQTPEGKLLDYKRELPGSTDEKKKEFLFDVSSFANASGGYLVYGVEEDAGIPRQFVDLGVANADAEIRRLQSIILDGLDPRIPGLGLRFIPTSKGTTVLVISIPKSWALPHMVTFKGTNKFYSRNAGGKYPVDVGELRALFALSQNTTGQIKNFRTERIAQILADETPIQH